jgi:hypothetical protein
LTINTVALPEGEGAMVLREFHRKGMTEERLVMVSLALPPFPAGARGQAIAVPAHCCGSQAHRIYNATIGIYADSWAFAVLRGWGSLSLTSRHSTGVANWVQPQRSHASSWKASQRAQASIRAR